MQFDYQSPQVTLDSKDCGECGGPWNVVDQGVSSKISSIQSIAIVLASEDSLALEIRDIQMSYF